MTTQSATGSEVRVSCGANDGTYSLVGKTIGDARKELRGVLNIPEGAQALVGGDEAGESYQLKPGDEVEFVKQAGQNG